MSTKWRPFYLKFSVSAQWLSDDIDLGQHWLRCLVAWRNPRYLNQCWLLTNGVPCHSPKPNFTGEMSLTTLLTEQSRLPGVIELICSSSVRPLTLGYRTNCIGKGSHRISTLWHLFLNFTKTSRWYQFIGWRNKCASGGDKFKKMKLRNCTADRFAGKARTWFDRVQSLMKVIYWLSSKLRECTCQYLNRLSSTINFLQ